MQQAIPVQPHPDGSGDSMIVLPDDVWEQAQHFGWKAGSRYFITRQGDNLHLHRLDPDTLQPVTSIRKSRFKRELNQQLRSLKETQVIEIGATDHVLIKRSLYEALVSLLDEETDPSA
jgi:hypothetical protein